MTPPGYADAVNPSTRPVSWHAKNLAEPDLILAANRENGTAESRAELALGNVLLDCVLGFGCL